MRFLVFGTGPQGLGPRGADLRSRFAAFLHGELAEEVDVVALESYAALLDAFSRGVVSIAWLPPALFVAAHDRFDAVMVLKAERPDGESYRGALFVDDDSAYESIEDLAGARVAWVDSNSCGGYLFPRLELTERGYDPDALFSEQRFHGSHAAVVHAVARGEADVGATFVYVRSVAEDPVLRAGWTPHVGTRGMRRLLVTEPIPADAIAVAHVVDVELVDRLRDALAAMHRTSEGRALLDALFQASRFAPGDPDEYATVWRASAEAPGLRQTRPGPVHPPKS